MNGNEISTAVGVVAVGYFLGAVPVGYLMARWQKGIDLRSFGSGSTGTTNVLRALGWKASAVVFAADLLKTVLPVALARLLTDSATVEALTGVAAIAGHCWPVYSGWSGGRGATGSFAGLLVIQPYVALAGLAVALGTIARTRFVSLGSIVGVSFGGIVMAVLIASGVEPLGYLIYTIGAPFIVLVRHRDNIQRLLAGTERKLEIPSPGSPGSTFR